MKKHNGQFQKGFTPWNKNKGIAIAKEWVELSDGSKAVKLPLTNNTFALIDENWFDYLNQWKWYCSPNGYAERRPTENGNKITYTIHRIVANTPIGMFTDHINRNKLDNRSVNLRNVTKSDNALNSKKRTDNTSGHTGIYLIPARWEAKLTIGGKDIRFGAFKTKEEAIEAYHKKVLLHKISCC